MAVLDVAGFVADLKDHAVEHGFHVHDERHFVESYSLRQTWEVDVHPEEGCEGPLDLYLSLEIDKPGDMAAFFALTACGPTVFSPACAARLDCSNHEDRDVPTPPRRVAQQRSER
jgi:hypothetical protein